MFIRVSSIAIAASAVVLSKLALAGTVIEMKYGEASSGKVSIDNGWARADQSQSSSEFLLANLDTGEVFQVNSNSRLIAVLPADAGKSAASSSKLADVFVPEGTALEQAGKGPRIASYPTDRYELRVKERVCGEIFVTSKLKSKDFDRYEQVMSDYSHEITRQMLSRAESQGMTANVCDLAALAVEPQVRRLGRVLKFTREGKPMMEVLAVNSKAKVDATGLKLPEDFERVSLLPPTPADNQKLQPTESSEAAKDAAKTSAGAVL